MLHLTRNICYIYKYLVIIQVEFSIINYLFEVIFIMLPKASSRFTAKSSKEHSKGREKVLEIEDVVLKQPWTQKREDVANDLPDYSLECVEPLVIKKKPLINWFDNICYFRGDTAEKRPDTMEKMLEVFWANDSNKFLAKFKDDVSS